MNPDFTLFNSGVPWWGDDGGGGSGGGGFEDYTPPSCPDVDTTIFPSANGGIIKGVDMRKGEAILNHSNEVVIVEQCEKVWAEYRYYTETILGANLINSATHHFLTHKDDDKGKSAMRIRQDQDDLVCSIRHNICLAYQTEFTPYHAGYVLRMSVSSPHTYLAGQHEGLYLASHNKPIYIPIGYYGQ